MHYVKMKRPLRTLIIRITFSFTIFSLSISVSGFVMQPITFAAYAESKNTIGQNSGQQAINMDSSNDHVKIDAKKNSPEGSLLINDIKDSSQGNNQRGTQHASEDISTPTSTNTIHQRLAQSAANTYSVMTNIFVNIENDAILQDVIINDIKYIDQINNQYGDQFASIQGCSDASINHVNQLMLQSALNSVHTNDKIKVVVQKGANVNNLAINDIKYINQINNQYGDQNSNRDLILLLMIIQGCSDASINHVNQLMLQSALNSVHTNDKIKVVVQKGANVNNLAIKQEKTITQLNNQGATHDASTLTSDPCGPENKCSSSATNDGAAQRPHQISNNQNEGRNIKSTDQASKKHDQSISHELQKILLL